MRRSSTPRIRAMAGSTIPLSRSSRMSARRNCGVSWALAPEYVRSQGDCKMTDQKNDGPKGGSNQNKGSGSDTASAAKISAGTSVGNVGEVPMPHSQTGTGQAGMGQGGMGQAGAGQSSTGQSAQGGTTA